MWKFLSSKSRWLDDEKTWLRRSSSSSKKNWDEKKIFFPLKNHFYLDRHKNATKIPNSKLMFKYFSSECHYMRVKIPLLLSSLSLTHSLTLFSVDDGKSPEMIGFGASKNKFDNRALKNDFYLRPLLNYENVMTKRDQKRAVVKWHVDFSSSLLII